MNINFKYYPNKQYPWCWYYSPQGAEFAEVMQWCYDTFGPPVRNNRWDIHGGWINFSDPADAMLFTLRWA